MKVEIMEETPRECEACEKVRGDTRRRLNLPGKPVLCLPCFEEYGGTRKKGK